MTDITPHQLELAREWAEYATRMGTSRNDARAAIDLIESLPDEWVDADELRDILTGISNGVYEVGAGRGVSGIAEDLRALLSAPDPRKTLADMTPEERKACRWMKVEVHGVPCELGVIIYLTEYHATVMWNDGTTSLRDHKELTPLPDLPRMVWPDEHHPATDTEETPEPALPRPEDVPEGELWLVEFDGQQGAAERELPGTEYPWWLMRGWRASDKGITLVSRLVPEGEQA